jgi:hypothetical protein
MGAKAWKLLESLSAVLPALPTESHENARRREAFEALLAEVEAVIRDHARGKLTTVEHAGALIIRHADTQIIVLRVVNGSLEMRALHDEAACFEVVPDVHYDPQSNRACGPPQRDGEWSTDAVDSVVAAIDKAVRAWKDGAHPTR